MKRILPLFLLLLSAPLAHAAPSVSLVPSRTTGVAPLSVFFDATLTTDPAVTSKPFHELEYTWNFGDDDTVTWSTGAHVGDGSIYSKKNRASGPVSAHVYETPGTYTVTLSVFDGITTSTQTQTITVQDPNVVFSGTNTICIAATTDPVPGGDGCPTGADHHQLSDWPTIVGTYALTGKRVLLKSGDIFTGTASAVISAQGPGIIGSYGALNSGRAIIRVTGSWMLTVGTSDGGLNGAKDWRVMNLELDGQSTSVAAIGTWGAADQLLVLHVYAHDIGGFFHSAPEVHVAGAMYDQIMVVDNIAQNLQGGGVYVDGIFTGSSHFAAMGNLIDNGTGNTAHLMRIWYANGGVISNNTISRIRATANVEMLALRMPVSQLTAGHHECGYQGDPTPDTGLPNLHLTDMNAWTKNVVVSDNYIPTNSVADTSINVGPASGSCPGHIQNVLVERNYLTAAANGAPGIKVGSGLDQITVRNNIVDASGGVSGIAIVAMGSYGVNPAAQNVMMHNNSVYSSDAKGMYPIFFEAGTTGVAKNNFAYAPAGVSGTMFGDSSQGGLITCTSCNTSDQQYEARGVAPFNAVNYPLFSVYPPLTPSSFKMQYSSYAISSGTNVPVFSDFFGTKRSTSIFDMGAVAYNTLSSTPTPQPLTGDLNSDHIVNALDWSLMNAKWFTNDTTADLNRDGVVNAIDFSLLNANWFKTW